MRSDSYKFWRAGIVLCILTFAFDPGLWISTWNDDLPRAWDGSGHYAVAQLYARDIFPDTFGWLPNYFAGMPFPNYYPPCFYWLVAALAKFSPLSLHSAFVLVLAASAASIPIAIWCLARGAARRHAVAMLAAIAVFPLLFDKRGSFPLGLNYPSTFFVGLYTQPLGLVFLALWYRSFLRARRPIQWLAAALLLALVFLSNLFAAAPAVMLWLCTIAYNLFRTIKARAPRTRKRLASVTSRQVLTFLIALLLAGFWLFPVLAHGSFFVTRPVETPGKELVNPLLPLWYAVAAAGIILWLRRPTVAAVPMVTTLVFGYAGLFISRYEVLLPWFPLQIPRFLTCLNFLLAVPVGIALSEVVGWFLARVTRQSRPAERDGSVVVFRPKGYRYAPIPVTIAAVALLLTLRTAVETPDYRLAFYSASNGDLRRAEPILQFARTHAEGRYLVEQIPFREAGSALDSRAISSYLGTQGNDVASIVFREAPISSVFLIPLIGAMSAGKDNFGLSSILAEDADFLSQSMERHLRQAEIYRMRYLVVFSNSLKHRLERLAPDRYARYDFGAWSVFELKAPPRPEAIPLACRPVLLLTSFSAKLTRRSDYHFLRLAEEEFMLGNAERGMRNAEWLDTPQSLLPTPHSQFGSPGVPIAFHPDYRTDRLPDPELFSALVVESYRYGNINTAFEQIKRFSQKKPTVLVEADNPLFRLLKDRQRELGKTSVVSRIPANDDGWIGTGTRAFSYRQNAVRQTWQNIKAALGPALQDQQTDSATSCEVTRTHGGMRIHCDGDRSRGPVAVSVNSTFHPNWQAADGRPVMMLGPSLIYTVVQGTAELRFRRSPADVIALILSAVTLVLAVSWVLRGKPACH